MRQSDRFLSGEGDNWFIRNRHMLGKQEYLDVDFLVRNLPILEAGESKFLEIGCSSGEKTFSLSSRLKSHGFGIDPSYLAIEKAREMHNGSLTFSVGTADLLPYENHFFDLVYFGFCLYLIDREHLDSVFMEATRVLKKNAFLSILDFDYGGSKKNTYKHDTDLFSYKDDYSAYLKKHQLILVAKESYTPLGKIGLATNPDDRVAISLYARVSD
jgi:ubiquinone/menaquinone biosynthesis C-methylase UbiE